MSSSVPTSLANGRYQLGQLVGRGGMAEVRVALDKRLGRTVAIKIMRRDVGKDHDFEARFEREAQAMAKLNHPNIISVIDFGATSVKPKRMRGSRPNLTTSCAPNARRWLKWCTGRRRMAIAPRTATIFTASAVCVRSTGVSAF